MMASMDDIRHIPELGEAIAAMEECARGAVACLLVSPPSIAPTMLARRIATSMPPMSALESTWVTAEFEGVGMARGNVPLTERPFRAPHHTISAAALEGTWRDMHAVACAEMHATRPRKCNCKRERQWRPGEAELARFGVLYLDDLTEFGSTAMFRLRFALDRMTAGRPLVVASTAPCPCGWRGYTERQCVCPSGAIDRYLERAAARQKQLHLDRVIRLPALSVRDVQR